MIKRLYRSLKQLWLLSLLLVLALALLIWFAGPLVAVAGYVPLAAEGWRFLVIAALLLAWGLNNLRGRVAERRAEARLAEDLAADAEPGGEGRDERESSAEQAMLARRLREALSILQGAGLGRGRKLYRLPWYVIIGVPGSGKTTALKNAGLRFPLEGEIGDNPVQGAGGTRYCDWWFTDEAVLIDTAGRYTTQDNPRRVESKAWINFLGLLRKHRPRRPLNGVLVTVSVQDLLDKTATQLAMQAAAIKQRVQELNSHLGMDLPVYVVFTKCDLIAGFREYFADLEAAEREQPWGITFSHLRPSRTGAALETFPEQFQRLLGRAAKRIPGRLDTERDARRRGLVFEFPRQMLGLGGRIQALLRDVFVPNQFEPPLLLRGVYFVSATQPEGVARWVRGVVPPALCSDPVSGAAAASGASGFFLHRLLRDIVFAEAGMAAANRRARMRFRMVYGAALAGVLALFVGTAAAWMVSYDGNMAYLRGVAAHVEDYRARTAGGLDHERRDWVVLAAGLDELAGIPGGHAERAQEPPMTMRFGLYQGERVGGAARQAYQRALERFLLPMTARMMVETLRDPVEQARDDYLYEALRFYLMLYHPEHRDLDSLVLWADLLWQRQLPGERHAQTRTVLAGHLRAALEAAVQPPEMDVEAVERARTVLVQTPLDRRLYRRLKSSYMEDNPGVFSVEGVLGKKAEVIFYRPSGKSLDEGVPLLFTYKHFHTGFRPRRDSLARRLGEESWIYGDMMPDRLSDEALEALKAQVTELYFEEYVARWRALLDDLRVRSFNNPSQGRVVVNMLASSQQPLLELLQAIRKHTALSEAPKTSKAAKQTADAVSDALMRNEKQRLERLLPSDADAAAVTLPGERVTDAFINFNDYVSNEQGMPLQRLQRALGRLSDYMDALAYARDVQETAFRASAQDQSSGAAINALRQALSAAPEPVQQWFGALPGALQQVNAAAAKGHVNDVWRSQVVRFYDEAIRGRYPVDPTASEEIRLEDFRKFFGPGGILDGYFQNYIKPFADTSGEVWRWHTPVGIPRGTLRFFQQVARIKRAYFADGGEPRVGFMLKPHRLDQAATRLLLETGGSRVSYQHGPVRSALFSWPGESDLSRLVFNLASRGTPVSTRLEGAWSWFRLLDRHAQLTPMAQADGFIVRFSVQGLSADYELRPRSVHHPFGESPLRGFSLPRHL